MGEETWHAVATIGAAGCLVVSVIVCVSGWRRRLGEVAVLGIVFTMASALPLSTALGGTGWFDDAPGASLATTLAVPLAAVAALPITFRRDLVRRWEDWVVAMSISGYVLAVAFLASEVGASTIPSLALVAVGALALAPLVRRQWTLWRIARLRASVVVAVAVPLFCASAAVLVVADVGSVTSWIVLGIENVAVAAAGLAVLVAYRVEDSVAEVIAPVTHVEPLAALDVGLAPEVRSFVAALESKDPVTRDHVVRVGALALRVGLRAGFSPSEVRALTLGAILHDIGKLLVPSEILDKPGALNDDEFAAIKSHPEAGARLVDDVASLAGSVRFVRGHHERYDGRGYPDGLAGDDVGIDLSIVSAVDAWDAMTNSRPYRSALPLDDARRILREGAGVQWHPNAVDLVLAEVEKHAHADVAGLVESRRGDTADLAAHDDCDCFVDIAVAARMASTLA